MESKPSFDSERAATANRLGRIALTIDTVMMLLLLLNLSWLLLDSAFGGSQLIRSGLQRHAGWFYRPYNDYIHQNRILVDSVFVSVFITELTVRWAVAIKRQTYHRWFFYPLIHWYDVLGCVPITAMRFLRILRVVAITYRLHRLGIVDVRGWYLFRVFSKYADIALEELSDRIVVHVLSGVQQEISQGSPIVDRIWAEVVAPHKDRIVEEMLSAADTLRQHSLARDRPALESYVERVLTDSLDRSRHVFKAFEAIPIVGHAIVEHVEVAIKVIVWNVVEQLLQDARGLDLRPLALRANRAIGASLSRQDKRFEELCRQGIHQAVEIIKDQVKVQQWKLREKQASQPTQTDPLNAQQ